MLFSDEARAMIRPRRTYASLAETGRVEAWDGRMLAAKVAMLQLALGGFVSLTSAGRLVAAHVAMTALFWVFLPMWQMVAVAIALRVVAPKTTLVRALCLYFIGHGPWLAFLLVISGVCIFAPDVYAAMMKLLTTGALPALILVAFVWGGVLTWAFFRSGLALSRLRAAAATAIFYVVFIGAIVGYYFATDQILPQFFWSPAP
jgi:hypothetical protein